MFQIKSSQQIAFYSPSLIKQSCLPGALWGDSCLRPFLDCQKQLRMIPKGGAEGCALTPATQLRFLSQSTLPFHIQGNQDKQPQHTFFICADFKLSIS